MSTFFSAEIKGHNCRNSNGIAMIELLEFIVAGTTSKDESRSRSKIVGELGHRIV